MADRKPRLLARLWWSIEFWFLNPRCPFCDSRSQNLERHIHVDHAGDDDLLPPHARQARP